MSDHVASLTPMRAMRAKCLDCCCGSTHEVKHCSVIRCSLHPYRSGHRPATTAKAPRTPAQLAAAERLGARAKANSPHSGSRTAQEHVVLAQVHSPQPPCPHGGD